MQTNKSCQANNFCDCTNCVINFFNRVLIVKLVCVAFAGRRRQPIAVEP